MIKPICAICQRELNFPGAILLSPPDKGMVKKFHICTVCYETVWKEKKRGERKNV